jgi:hypothetical protein
MTCPIAEAGGGGGAPSFDWLQRTAFALSLYVLAIAPELNVKPMNGSDPKAMAFKAVRASPFVFEVLGIAFVRSQKAPDVEDGPLLNPSPRLFMCCDADIRSVYCNICMGLLVSTIQEPKSKAKRHFGFGHRLGVGRLVSFPHHSIFST